ncbi:unnamed protein product [Rhizoctonia solani]|uniref:Transmembrane protein n=1 Tax=Rhizoctonia solani TaxID=456999 RepID=A0A8H2WFI8_9AGAM|nr:unnamed protein product [Rhizoctonia solani]
MQRHKASLAFQGTNSHMVIITLQSKWNDLLPRIIRLLWLFTCIITLGFAPKYYRKVQGWQVYDLTNQVKDRKAYEDHVNSSGLGMKSSKRAKQQREWDRLLVPLSVITATSAAALAIPSPFSSGIHWVATACFTCAFGLSLEGLLLIMYLTVFAGGACAETIGRMASGKAFLKGRIGPVAFVIAFPTAIATYSFLFLFIESDSKQRRKEEKGEKFAGYEAMMPGFRRFDFMTMP